MTLHDVRRIHLPYCVQRQADGRYILLNRDYKPLGFADGAQYRYEDYPVAVHIKGLTSKVAAELSYKGDANADAVFLYGDSCIPTRSKAHMSAYLGRLTRLMALKASHDAPPRPSRTRRGPI